MSSRKIVHTTLNVMSGSSSILRYSLVTMDVTILYTTFPHVVFFNKKTANVNALPIINFSREVLPISNYRLAIIVKIYNLKLTVGRKGPTIILTASRDRASRDN